MAPTSRALVVPSDTAQVLLQVVIESSEYETFWASLQDSASGRILWRSGDLRGTADGGNRIVQVTIPGESADERPVLARCVG